MTLQWFGTVDPLFEACETTQKSQQLLTMSVDIKVPAGTFLTLLSPAVKNLSHVLTLIITIVIAMNFPLQAYSNLLFIGLTQYYWNMTIWSFDAELLKTITSAGTSLFLWVQASTALRVKFIMTLNLDSMLSYASVLEKMDEKVEFTVAHIASVVFRPPLAFSKATIIAPPKLVGILGTHKVFPLLAMIWSRILVAILCRFFLRRVISVAIWQTILFLTRADILIFLYCVLSWLGRIIRQMLQSYLSPALRIFSSISSIALLKSKSPKFIFTDSNFTLRFLEVESKVSIRTLVSVPEKQRIAHLMLCLLEYIGLLKRLKNASFPSSIAWLSPRFNLGIGMILASTVARFVLIFMPISFKEQKS